MVSYQSAKEEIKRAADIAEFIGQFVQLKKAGRNYVGLCPFHSEKAPSFTVSPERQTFHCFGCKKGGDIFSFWMEYHGATFPEAFKDLAESYQVAIPEGPVSQKDGERAALREALFKTNEKATAYFQDLLAHPVSGKPGREYLARRLLPKEIVSEFRLGYTPDEWEGLTGFLRRHHVDLSMAVQAGLIIPKKGGGYYDRFRGRIIFPIFNLRKQVVGFGGRVLDDSLPKYVNTPETPIFQKGEFPYGLHATYKMIREKQRAVIVEGYMDFLALRGHGVDEVVATLGTALTGSHVRKLKGYAKNAVMVFDSDEAGKAAVLKSLPLFLNEGVTARAVVLPDGHDPDSFVSAQGLTQFSELLNGASSLFDFYLEQKVAPGDSDEAKIAVLKELLPCLSEIRSFSLQSLYVQRLSEKIGINEEVMLSELRAFMKNASEKALEMGIRERLKASGVEKSVGELQLLNLLIHHADAVSMLMDSECKLILTDPAVLEIVDAIFRKYHEEGPFAPEVLLESLDSEAAREQVREILHRPFIYSDEDVEQAVFEIKEKVYQEKISRSFDRVGGDMEGLNELLKMKARRPTRP
jgi:DNA primase